MTEDRVDPVRFEDVVGLKSRISWGAVFAGSVVALAVSLVFTLFFAALGFSLSDADVRAGTVGYGVLAVAVLTMAVALFVGGGVTTALTAGETRSEAVIHGILTWAVVSFFSVLLVGAGVRAGYNALLAAANGADAAAQRQGGWEQSVRQMGASQQQIDAFRAQLNPEAAKAAANDPNNRQTAQNVAIGTAWAAFAGTLVAMGACIGGAVFGSGPRFRFVPVAVQTVGRQQPLAAAR